MRVISARWGGIAIHIQLLLIRQHFTVYEFITESVRAVTGFSV